MARVFFNLASPLEDLYNMTNEAKQAGFETLALVHEVVLADKQALAAQSAEVVFAEALAASPAAVSSSSTTASLSSSNQRKRGIDSMTARGGVTSEPVAKRKAPGKNTDDGNKEEEEEEEEEGRLKTPFLVAGLPVYIRAHIDLKQSSHVHFLNQSGLTNRFDVISMSFSDEKMFLSACLSYDIDLISLDLTRRLPFSLKFAPVSAAITRGVYFEIDIAPLFTDASSKRTLLSNGMNLVRITKGKNIVISNSTKNKFHFRSPKELIQLGLLFGLKEHEAVAAVTLHPSLLLSERRLKRRSFKKIVIVE